MEDYTKYEQSGKGSPNSLNTSPNLLLSTSTYQHMLCIVDCTHLHPGGDPGIL